MALVCVDRAGQEGYVIRLIAQAAVLWLDHAALAPIILRTCVHVILTFMDLIVATPNAMIVEKILDLVNVMLELEIASVHRPLLDFMLVLGALHL